MKKSTPTSEHKVSLGKTSPSEHTGITRINLSIPTGLLKLVDEAARQDFATRSDLIRQALIWYLRPQGRELDQADPEVILKTLQQRHLHNEVKKMLKNQ